MKIRTYHVFNSLSLFALLLLLSGCGREGGKPALTDEETELFDAVAVENVQRIEELAGRGVNIDVAGNGGVTPLMTAVRSNLDASVEALLRLGADIRALDENGDSALMYAVRAGGTETVVMLLGLEKQVEVGTYAPPEPVPVRYEVDIDELRAMVETAVSGLKDDIDRTLQGYVTGEQVRSIAAEVAEELNEAEAERISAEAARFREAAVQDIVEEIIKSLKTSEDDQATLLKFTELLDGK